MTHSSTETNSHTTQPTSIMALARSMLYNRQLIAQMTKREVAGRYKGSALGLAWSFFNPVFMLVVYFLIVTPYKHIMARKGASVFGEGPAVKTCQSCLSDDIPAAATKCKYCGSDQLPTAVG